MNKRIFSFLISIIFVLNGFTAVYSAIGCKPELDSYTIKNNVNMNISRIEQGERANISIDIIDSNIKTSEISSSDNIDVISVDGSFGSIDEDSIDIISSGSDELKYTINFKNAVYTGFGNSISFKIKYNNLNITSDKIYVTINECSEKDVNNESNKPENKQPYVEIGRSDISKPIKANESFTLQLIVKNRGSAKMKRPVMTISLPDSINSLDGVGNIQIPDIEAGTSRAVTLRLKATDYIQYSSEEIDINLNYNYDSPENGLVSAAYNDRIFIPMEAQSKNSAPLIQISRGALSAPVNGNEEFILPITIKNIGNTAISTPLLSVTVPEEMILLEDNTALELPSLKPGQEYNHNLKLKTKKYISNAAQELSAELKYNYKSGNEYTQGSESTKLIIPAKPNDEEGSEPLLHIVSESIENPLKSNEKFSIKVTINNIGTTDLKAGVLNWETGEGIILTDKTSSLNIESLKAGESKEIIIKGKTADKVSATTQVINGELTYKYENSKSMAQGQETIKIVVPTLPEEEDVFNNATPNIIISKYNYGGVPIANGNTFNFDVEFKNTSKNTSIENIVMSIETDAGLSIHSASNTYFYEKISPSGFKTQSVGMQVLPSAETGSVKLTMNFSYEYVENGGRKQVSSSQNVSIPVYKPDKLEITLEPLPVATVGIEQTVSLSYVNKGKGELSNVKAEITGDITALTSVQNLGNFEPGKSGSISFVVIPEIAGEVNFTVKISYEDANLEQKTLEFPCTITVEEAVNNDYYPEDDMDMEEEGSSHKGIIIVSVIGLVILIIIIVIVVKKRKKKKLSQAVKINWEAEDEDQGLN